MFLISLLDSVHVHHNASSEWFEDVASHQGWATCPITENGFIRVVSGFSYPNLQLSPAHAARSLKIFKDSFRDRHEFWPDELTLTDPTLFDLTILANSSQLTDAYLVALTFKRQGRLATLDNRIPWQAIRGAHPELIEKIPTTTS